MISGCLIGQGMIGGCLIGGDRLVGCGTEQAGRH